RQPASVPRARDPFLPEACRAHRPRYPSRSLLGRPQAPPKEISPRGGGTTVRGNLPAAARPGGGRRRRVAWALARPAISFRAPPSDTCRGGVISRRLSTRAH